MIELPHLASGAAALANSPNETRIRAIRSDRWVGFDRARRVLRHLDGLCDHPPSTRPPGLAIYGHSGMGKTMLVEKFKRNHPPIIDHSTGVESMPVLAITLTSRPTERRIYGQLLMAMGASIAGDTQLARRLDQFVLPRWKADEEFQELVTAILRSLPLKLPSALSSQSLRHLSRLGDGITARVFGILNELAIEAIQDGTERITDENIESWKPALEKEAAFA